MRVHVLDASAMMVFFEDRPGAAAVESLIGRAADEKQPLLMSSLQWGEVMYTVWRTRGRQAAEAKAAEISLLPVRVVDPDLAAVRQAAAFKAEQGLPYVDGFAAALAMQRKGTLVTSDPDFKKIGRHIQVLWLPKG